MGNVVERHERTTDEELVCTLGPVHLRFNTFIFLSIYLQERLNVDLIVSPLSTLFRFNDPLHV